MTASELPLFPLNTVLFPGGPLPLRIFYFLLVLAPTVWLTLYTVVKSKRLSDFLEALSDERLAFGRKLDALRKVWSGAPPPR